MSDRLLEAIDARLDRPTRDPHGDAIPAPDGTLISEPAVRLDEAPTGHEGRVIRISDRDPGVLRALHEAQIGPGSELGVADATGEASVVVTLAGRRHALPRAVAEVIWISA